MDTATAILARIAQALEREDGGASVPKYIALYNEMLSTIESGLWPPGTRLPTEATLANSLPVSLGTVQRALRLLSDSGAVTRRQGDGTFVAGAKIRETEIRLLRFLDSDDRTFLPLYTTILSIDSSREEGPWSDFLKPETTFILISRIINVNNEFSAYSRLFFSGSHFGDLLSVPRSDLDGIPLSRFVDDRFNAPTIEVKQRLSFLALPDHVCKAIRTPAATVGLRWELMHYTYRGAPLYFHELYLPPNDRKLELSPSQIKSLVVVKAGMDGSQATSKRSRPDDGGQSLG